MEAIDSNSSEKSADSPQENNENCPKETSEECQKEKPEECLQENLEECPKKNVEECLEEGPEESPKEKLEKCPKENNTICPKEKKKRRRLTIKERIALIDRMTKGESNEKLTQEFGISNSVILRISKNIEKLAKYRPSTDSESQDLETAKLPKLKSTIFEKVLYVWFKQKKCLGEPVFGTQFSEKALEMNKKMNGPKSFRASVGWMQRYKERHNLQSASFHKPSLNDKNAVEFRETFLKFLEEHDINPENVYCADEMSLAWKSIPTENQLHKRRSKAGNTEKINILLCSNATGSHKIPLLLIGNEKVPEDVIEQLSLMYEYEKDCQMTLEIFQKWYKETFLLEVRQRHQDDFEKCFLLVDSDPAHPEPESLSEEDELCEVQLLPTDVTTLLLPINQGIARNLKTNYKICLMKDFLSRKPLNYEKFYKRLTLKQCSKFLNDSWERVTKEEVQGSWQKLIKREDDWERFQEDPNIPELLGLLRKLPCCSRFNAQSTRYWVEEDNDDPGWIVLNDDQIIKDVTAKYTKRNELVKKMMDKSKTKMAMDFAGQSNDLESYYESFEGQMHGQDNFCIDEEVQIKQEDMEEEDIAVQAEQNEFFFQDCSVEMDMDEGPEPMEDEVIAIEPKVEIFYDEDPKVIATEPKMKTEDIEILNVWSNEANFNATKNGADLAPKNVVPLYNSDVQIHHVWGSEMPSTFMNKSNSKSQKIAPANESEVEVVQQVWSPPTETPSSIPKKPLNAAQKNNPSAFDALTSADVLYKWFEQRGECSPQDLIRLRQIREIARKEILCLPNRI